MCGGILLATGILGTGFAPNIGVVYLTFGVIAGKFKNRCHLI